MRQRNGSDGTPVNARTDPFREVREHEAFDRSLDNRPAVRLEIGARVRVQISKPEEYAQGAAESMNGKTGVIVELRKDGKAWLVRFDTPVKKWWTHQSSFNAFWFEPHELRGES